MGTLQAAFTLGLGRDLGLRGSLQQPPLPPGRGSSWPCPRCSASSQKRQGNEPPLPHHPHPGRTWTGSWPAVKHRWYPAGRVPGCCCFPGSRGCKAAMVSCSRRGAEALGRPCSVGLMPHSGAACAPGIPVPGAGASSWRAAGNPGRAAEAPCAHRPHPQSLEAPRWLVTTGWSKRGGRREPRQPHGMLGWLAACPGPGPGSASREAVNNPEPAFPSASWEGPLGVPPCGRCPACWPASPPPPQLLLPGASAPGAPAAGDAPTAKKSPAEGPAPAPAPARLLCRSSKQFQGGLGIGSRICTHPPCNFFPAAGDGQDVPFSA